MSRKQEVNARDLITDIRAGLSDSDLMERYRLTDKGLQSAFRKLVTAGLASTDDFDGRLRMASESVVDYRLQRPPRCYLVMPVPVYDLADLLAEGIILDLTEKGLKVAGLKARVGQKKNLLVRADEFQEVFPFCFDAQCRWVAQEADGKSTAGFEITSVTEVGLKELRKVIASMTICE
jgi:hypothetical protein